MSKQMTAQHRQSSAIDFSLSGRVAIVTGGAGLLGLEHAKAIAAANGIPVLADIRGADATATSPRPMTYRPWVWNAT